MILGFIFAHLNAVALGVWMIFLGMVLMRFLRPSLIGNISYSNLIFGAVALHLCYAVFLTWGQYHLWATASDFTRSLLMAPLPSEVPIPAVLEFLRPYLSGTLGYFSYYAFGRFFFNIITLFVVAGVLYGVLKLWNSYKKNFEAEDLEIFLILMLIAGWPGIMVLVPLGFVAAVLFLVGSTVFFKQNKISLIPVFLFTTPVVLIGGKAILDFLSLYSVLKI